jgi:hypothetical protein
MTIFVEKFDTRLQAIKPSRRDEVDSFGYYVMKGVDNQL